MGSRNIVKLLIAISAGWLLFCASVIGFFVFSEMNKPQWQKDADEAAEQSESNRKRAITLYEKAIAAAQNDNVAVLSRLDLMEKYADLLFSDSQYLEAKAEYHAGADLARRSRLLEQQSDFLIYESQAWHEAYRLGVAEMPDADMVKTALALRSDKEELPNKSVQTAHIDLADIALDHEQYGKAVNFYKKALADASTLKDGDGKRDARLGMIAVAVIQKNYRLANDIFLEGVEDKDGDANNFRSNYLSLMIEAAANADPEYDSGKSNLLELLKAQEFASLDKVFALYLKERNELLSGQMPVDRDLSDLKDSLIATSNEWKNQVTTLTSWNQKYPHSQAARLLLADVLATCATGIKSQPDGDDKKDDSPDPDALLARAQRVLNEEKVKTPCWYNCSQTVAAANSSFDKAQYDKIVAECEQKFPNYKQTIFAKAAVLLPDAHGENGEVEKYVDDECRKLPAPQSDIMYAQIVMYLETNATNDTLNVTSLSWDRTKKGIRSLLAVHKDWLVGKTLLSILATEANDTTTAENAFAQ